MRKPALRKKVAIEDLEDDALESRDDILLRKLNALKRLGYHHVEIANLPPWWKNRFGTLQVSAH